MNFGATGTGLSGIGSSVHGGNTGTQGQNSQPNQAFGFGASMNPLMQGPSSVSNYSSA
jgi:hypothetical protein